MAGSTTCYSFCLNFPLNNKDKLVDRALINGSSTSTTTATASCTLFSTSTAFTLASTNKLFK